MPGLNQTGPMGEGPMTGRKMGRCTNYTTQKPEESTEINKEPVGFWNRSFRLGLGLGRRNGCRGRRGGMQQGFGRANGRGRN